MLHHRRLATRSADGRNPSLTFSSGGDQLHRGQWDGWIVAYDARDSNREDPLGRLDWQSWKEWTDDEPPIQVERFRVKMVEVRPELRRRGIATALYNQLFKQEGITAADLVPASLTPEGAAFRKGAALRESITDWQAALVRGDARYVPPVVVPQMPDIVARAIRAGAPAGRLEYAGAGMTSVVFCADGVAYKVARATRPIDHQFFEEESDWLAAAARVPAIAPHVARLRDFDPEDLVIVRDCPAADPDQSAWRYGEDKLYELHRQIERAMIPHGWTAPEFKPDSYVLTTRGPMLVDASLPQRVGSELARYVEDVARGARQLWTTRPADLAFAVRMESGKTLSPDESHRLEDLIRERWPEREDS
jgi:GNAT superfamily N-acetyltransferase